MWRVFIFFFLTVAHLCCSPPKMLLRMMWSRLATQLSANRKRGIIFAASTFFQTAQLHQYKSKPKTYSNLCGTWLSYMNSQHKHKGGTRHILHAVGGIGFPDSWTTPIKQKQKRLYSSNIVKSMLKPTIKPPPTSGKRVPKGPRTKQPSRANQPALNDEQVVITLVVCNTHVQTSHATMDFFIFYLIFFAGYDAVYCLCNGRPVSSPNTLPWPDQPWLSWDRFTKRCSWELIFQILENWGALRRACIFCFSDASNVLVISTDITAKSEDDALMFFFRWSFIFSQTQVAMV